MNRRGLTLAEVLVAGTIMVMMMGAILAIYQMGQNSQRKLDVHSDTYRNAMLALTHIRSELRGAQLVNPATGISGVATYRYPLMVDGQLQVEGDGEQIWAGTAEFFLDATGHLYKQDAARPEPRRLADLGAQGEIEFERVGPQRLRVRVLAVRGEAQGDVREKSRYEITQDFFLPNQ